MMVGVGWVLLAWNESWRRARAAGWEWPKMDPVPLEGWRDFKNVHPDSPIAHYRILFSQAEHQMHIDAHLAWHERNRHLLSGITSYHTGLPGAREELIRIARDRRLEREERKARRGV